MGRNRGKADNTSGEKKNSLLEDSNNLQSKIENKNESNVNKNNTDCLSALNMNVDQGTSEKSYHKEDVVASAAEASGSSSRPRRRCNAVSSYCPPLSPSPEGQPISSAAEASGSSSRPRRRCNAVSSYCPPLSPSPEGQPISSAAEASGSSSRPSRRCNAVSTYCPPRSPSPEGRPSSSAAEATGSSSRSRRRYNAVSSYCPPRSPSPEGQPSSSAKKMKIKKPKVGHRNIGAVDEVDNLTRVTNLSNQSLEGSSDDENFESNLKESASSAIAMDKLKFDFKVDPNIVDRYTDSGFTAGGSTPESPETRRQRIDIISRQCRLHPSNKKYNQGPVENPPLISPGKMVGYTPGGQRHEVDLNFDRPTWFNSEYARMQWDYATKVNVSRMFHDLETGMFLADGLDPNIERKYFAEQEMASKQAAEHFQEIANASSSHANGQSTAPDLTEEDKERLQLLEAEYQMIELNQYASVRFQDFAGEIVRKLRKALDLTLTPLMIKKNPIILDTLEVLATQCIHIDVVVAARALLDKIRGLFQVPENREFREFFAEEVEKLKEKTKNMPGFDIITMTEEPSDDEDDSESLPDTIPVNGQYEAEQDLSELEDEWVPIEYRDVWVDSLPDTNNMSHVSSIGSNMNVSDVSEDDDDEDVDDWTANEESDSLSHLSDSDEELEAQIDDFLGTLVSEE